MLTVSYIIRIVNDIKHDQVDIGSTPNSEGSNGTKNTNRGWRVMLSVPKEGFPFEIYIGLNHL